MKRAAKLFALLSVVMGIGILPLLVVHPSVPWMVAGWVALQTGAGVLALLCRAVK